MAKAKAGKLSLADIQKNINKKAGMNVASIICKGQYAGIPVGKIVEIAGLEATGKSYMAAQIAANAQKQGIDVVYFDSESAIDPSFLERAGCNLDNLLYIQAKSVEFVLETIDDLLKVDNQFLFVWDSLALTPVEQEVQGDFDPMSQMAMKARVLARAMSKLTINIANKQATLLVLNQLKTNITRVAAEAMTTPYVTPGGKAMAYAYSLRIWLTGRKAKASYVLDDNGFRIGSEVKVKLEKSRFGTAGRQCNFRILWGTDDAAIQDDESLFDAVKGSSNILQSGAWYTLVHDDGQEEKFQASKWVEKMHDDKFRQRVYQIMDEEVIMKFHTREGNAEDFYDNDDEAQVEENTFAIE
jgi:recombination protein RecA